MPEVVAHQTNIKPLENAIPNVDEFKNLMDIHKFLSIIEDAKRNDIIFRKNIFCEYFSLKVETIDELLKLPLAERKKMCTEQKINPFIFRTLFDYNRYPNCYLIYNFLSSKADLRNMKALDFGCLVSDYGFFFGMIGMTITFCDLKEHADFADYRLGKANIKRFKVYAPANYSTLTKGQDLAIFGEVLEHLTDPYEILLSCAENKVKYVYTSCYPYGDEAYFKLLGHTLEAKEQAPACLDLLKDNYEEISLSKSSRIWVAK